jgi:hypothetical protein
MYLVCLKKLNQSETAGTVADINEFVVGWSLIVPFSRREEVIILNFDQVFVRIRNDSWCFV